VLLADPESNDIVHLLRGENRTNLRLLRTLVRHPGLELRGMTFINEDEDEGTLSEKHVEELLAIESFQNYMQNWYGPPAVAGTFDITTTTREDFITFMGQHSDLENNPVLPDDDLMIRSYEMRTRAQDNNKNNLSRSNSPRSSRSTPPPPPTNMNYLLVQYNKEKRPLSDYTQHLKAVKEWSEFDRQLKALTHAHGVEKVLDEHYSPALGSDEEEVFNKMNALMYTVFVKLVTETRGLRIVKSHKDNMDAQEI